jgi:hypothetical protein
MFGTNAVKFRIIREVDLLLGQQLYRDLLAPYGHELVPLLANYLCFLVECIQTLVFVQQKIFGSVCGSRNRIGCDVFSYHTDTLQVRIKFCKAA